MPRSTREQLIRWHDQAQNDLDRCLINLSHMANTYGDEYLNHKTMVEMIAGVVANTQELLRQFRSEML